MSGNDIVNYFKNKYSSSDSKSAAQCSSMINDLKKYQNNTDDDSAEHTMVPSGNSTKKESIYDSERNSDIYSNHFSKESDNNEMSR